MAAKKRFDKHGNEYEYVSYDRSQTATFNLYSEDELKDFRTLMKQCGGVSAVAYELYKADHSYRDTQMTKICFNTVKILSEGDRIDIFTSEELSHKKATHKGFEYEIITTDIRSSPIKDHFLKSPRKIATYKHRVHIALNYNKGGNKDTKKVVKLLNKLAQGLHLKKQSQYVSVNKWLVGKDERVEDIKRTQTTKRIINTISAKGIIKNETDEQQ